MDPPQLLPPFTDLLARKNFSAYFRLLMEKGIDWWLDFQFPCIALHLAPLTCDLPDDVAPSSARFRFLTLCLSPGPSMEELDTLFHTFLAEEDHDAACACVGLALNAIWESGRAFNRSSTWNRRAGELWNSDDISSLAHGSLLLNYCFGEIAGGGDVTSVDGHLTTILSLAEETRSTSMMLMYSALGAYIYCWKADFAAFEIILDDTAPYLDTGNPSPVAILQHMISRGLFTLLQGKPKKGKAIFNTLLATPNLEQLPASMWLLLHGHFLYCLVSTGDMQGIDELTDTLRKKIIPEYNQYSHAYLHFNLGIAALAHSRPHKALLHSQEALRLGALCNSANAVRMSALLYGQALADLGRHEDALAHFSDWMPKWQAAEYFFIAALASVESGWIHLRLGEIDKAKSALRHGHSLIPAKEKILSIYRPVDYVARLEKALHSRTIEAQISGKPINIKTLGKFSVSVDGCIVDKGRWKGRQSKKLLQAIISLGGHNISTSYLADILWPDSDGDRAARAFKISLYRLRKVMNTNGSDYPWLVVRHNQISLSSEFCSVDAHIFEEEVRKAYVEPVDPTAIHHTLSIYTGNFLEIEGDEGWHIGKRVDLRDSFTRVSLRLFDHYKTHNAVKTGLPYLTRALKYDPTNETVLARAIESHLELGNKAGAIAMYNDTCHLLEQTHRIGPGKSLQALALKIQGKA